MNERQSQLFRNIVEEYIQTAQPVGSKLVVDKFNLNISPATVRNDMVELENLGLIRQPHTSAGRVPTEEGYRYYVKNFVQLEKELNKKNKQEMQVKVDNTDEDNFEKNIKKLARTIAEESNQGIIVGFPNRDVFYTGLSNLFSQSEFHDLDLISNVSNIFDHLDEIISEIYDDFSDQAEIIIGGHEHFPEDCSIVITKDKDVLFGIVGPTRMDYQENIKLLNFVKDIL
jgi:heat-inducible transcriptional repressor